MKLLIALMTLLTLSTSFADTTILGSTESFSSLTGLEKGDDRPRPPRPPGQYASRLFLQNNCYTDVLIGIRHIGTRGNWESKGYFRVYPGQIVYATDFRENYYYLHAYTSDHRVYWQGNNRVEIAGRMVPALMIGVNLPPQGGDWTTVLFCR